MTPLRPLLPLYLVIHIGFIGYGMMVTLFVQMLMDERTRFLPTGATTGQQTVVLGVLLALYPAGQFFATPVLSSLSDRFGRKRVLLPSLCATTACYALVAIAIEAESLHLLELSLLLCGLSEANIAIAQSAIADVSPPEDRGRLFGYVFIAIRLGYVVGPLIGGQIVLRTQDYAAPFWLVMALLVVAFFWTLAHFRETHPPQPDQPLRYRAAFTSLLTIFTDRPIRMLYLVNFFLYVAIFGFSRTILMYLVEAWHMHAGQITFFYAYFAVSVLLANLWLMPFVSKRLELQALAVGAAAVGGLGTMLIAAPRTEVWLWVLIGPSACLLSLCLSACAALLSNSVGPNRQGSVMGNNEALQVAAESVGAAGGGFLAAVFLRLPLLIFGGLVLLGALLLARFRIPAQQPGK